MYIYICDACTHASMCTMHGHECMHIYTCEITPSTIGVMGSQCCR